MWVCQELERIIEVLEERLSCDQQARTLQETQVRPYHPLEGVLGWSRADGTAAHQAKLEEAVCYAGELEERLIQSTRKWEVRGGIHGI